MNTNEVVMQKGGEKQGTKIQKNWNKNENMFLDVLELIYSKQDEKKYE